MNVNSVPSALPIESQSKPAAQSRKFLPYLAAWIVLLLVSDLPDVFWNVATGDVPGWLFYAKIGVLLATLLVCWLWKPLRALWQLAVVFTALYLALAFSTWWGSTPLWTGLFEQKPVSYVAWFTGFHIRDLAVALVVIAALWLVKRDRQAFFLTLGQRRAPIAPVRWLGIKAGESWRNFGWIFAGCAGLAILITILLTIPITAQDFQQALPLIPMALLLAAVNAFTEEIVYRASILSTLEGVIGKNEVLWLSAAFFGMAHVLYGSPPGVLGFALTGFLGFLMGKAMLETRGLAWAWFIHFVPDAFIFISYALTWK